MFSTISIGKQGLVTNDERLTGHVIGVRTGEVGDAGGHVFRF